MTAPETSIDIAVRSADMDADGIVNNAVYFIYFEQARLAHLVRLGIVNRPRLPGDPPRPFTLIKTEATYLAPLVHPQVVRITVSTRALGTSSFTLAYEAVRVGDGVRVAEGSSVQVWLGAEGRSSPLPVAVRQALSPGTPDPAAGTARAL